MPKQLFTNNAVSLLASSITDVATTLTVSTGHGARFPSPSGGDWFMATLFTYAGQSEVGHEIVQVTARSGDVSTIVRGQEGTTATAFNAGDPVHLRLTAGGVELLRDDLADLSGVTNASAARTALGLGTAAEEDVGFFATAAQGALAATAMQPAAPITSENLIVVCDGSSSALAPAIDIRSVIGNTDGKRWRWAVRQDGTDDWLSLVTLTDADAAGSELLRFVRTGSGPNYFYIPPSMYVGLGMVPTGAGISVGGIMSFGSSPATIASLSSDAYIENFTAIQAKAFLGASPDSLGATITGSVSWDLSEFQRYSGTITGNTTVTAITAPSGPTTIKIRLTQDGTGSRTLALPSSIKKAAGTSLTLSTAPNAIDLLILDYDGSNWIGSLMQGIA